MQVLIASQDYSAHLETLVRSLGHEVTVVNTGADALTYLKHNTPNMMLLDAHLSDVAGASIIYRYKRVKRLAHVPSVLFVDAHNPKARADASLSAAEHVVLKPYSASLIRSALSTHLGALPTNTQPYPNYQQAA